MLDFVATSCVNYTSVDSYYGLHHGTVYTGGIGINQKLILRYKAKLASARAAPKPYIHEAWWCSYHNKYNGRIFHPNKVLKACKVILQACYFVSGAC